MKGSFQFVMENFPCAADRVTGSLELLHDSLAPRQCLSPVASVLVDSTRAGSKSGKSGYARWVACGGDAVSSCE